MCILKMVTVHSKRLQILFKKPTNKLRALVIYIIKINNDKQNVFAKMFKN